MVEDNLDASESLKLLLTLSGHEVETADDGRTALERARAFRPEVVLCDLGLPGDLDGLAVAGAIRSDPALGSPYLVALTGFGQAEDREQARAAGFDRHLTKPADPDLLRSLLEDCRAGADPGSSRDRQGSSSSTPGGVLGASSSRSRWTSVGTLRRRSSSLGMSLLRFCCPRGSGFLESLVFFAMTPPRRPPILNVLPGPLDNCAFVPVSPPPCAR